MFSPENSSGVDEIRSLLDDFFVKIIALPQEQRDGIEEDLVKVKASISKLLRTRNDNTKVASEDNYLGLIESITDGFFEVNQDWYFTFVNARAASNIGTIPEDLIGKNMWEEFPALIGTTTEQYCREVMEKRQAVEFEMAGVYSQKWYSVRVYPSAKGIAILWFDITEQKRAEEEAKTAHDRAIWLARFPDENPNPVARVSEEGLVLYNNRISADTCCWSFQTGHQAPSIFIPLLEEAARSTKSIVRDLQIGERFYSVTLMPFPNQHYVNIYGLDITERRKVEETLRKTTQNLSESERRFRTMADGTPVIIWVTDPGGKMEFINQAYGDFFGVSLEQVRAGTWQILVHPDDQTRYVNVYFDCLRNRRPFRAQGRVRLKDGRWRWIDSQGQPRYSDTGEYLGMVGSSLDITERKEAEDSLQKSEEQFRALTLASAQVLYRMSPDWREMRQLHGGNFLADTVAPNPNWMMEYIHPDDREWVWAVIEKAVRLGTVFELEHRVLRADGTLGWTASRAVPVRSEAGGIIEWFGAASDITERKEAEVALEKAVRDLANERNRLLAMMEALPIGLSIQDHQGGILHHNKAFLELWGETISPTKSIEDYQADKGRWVDTGQLLQPEEWASALAIQKGETVSGQFIEIERFDGKHAFIMNSGAPIRDTSGEITGSAVAQMDVTNWFKTEKALHEAQTRFRVALQSVPLLVYTCDEQLRYTWMYNPLRGFQVNDVLGKRDDELIPYEAAREMIDAKQKALDTGTGNVQEVKIPLQGEDTYYILSTDPIYGKDKKVVGLTCSAIDITDQKRLQIAQQQQLVQLEIQQRLMEYRERDRATVARDLHNGPIQSLSGLMFQIQLLKDISPDPTLKSEINKIGLEIKHTIDELRITMNDLRPPALITFGFSKVMQKYIEDFHERSPEFEIEYDLQQDDKALSPLAHLTLYRICQEGLKNIYRHAGASKARVTFRIDQNRFFLELRDNGKGLMNSLDYSQLSRDGRFGLISMKERAEAIGATLSISSQASQGTTLTVQGLLGPKNLR